MLEYDIIKKRHNVKITTQLKSEADNKRKKCKIMKIRESIVYDRELARDHLLKLYYLVL